MPRTFYDAVVALFFTIDVKASVHTRRWLNSRTVTEFCCTPIALHNARLLILSRFFTVTMDTRIVINAQIGPPSSQLSLMDRTVPLTTPSIRSIESLSSYASLFHVTTTDDSQVMHSSATHHLHSHDVNFIIIAAIIDEYASTYVSLLFAARTSDALAYINMLPHRMCGRCSIRKNKVLLVSPTGCMYV